jgi:hypothetical protein
VPWRQASNGIAGADATPERPTSAQPSSALISALLTAHHTLQSTRGSTITEANGRSSQFLSAVSGATVAKELLPLRRPSGARRLLRACHPADSQLLFDVGGNDARRYWLLSAGDDKRASMRHTGQRLTPPHRWTHQATAVAAVIATIGGVLGGLALKPRLRSRGVRLRSLTS